MNLRAIISALRDQQEKLTAQVETLDNAIDVLSRLGGRAVGGGRKKRVLSAAGRARIAAGQRARWRKIRAATKV